MLEIWLGLCCSWVVKGGLSKMVLLKIRYESRKNKHIPVRVFVQRLYSGNDLRSLKEPKKGLLESSRQEKSDLRSDR